MLYGDSGAGKSSLINAGLIPEALSLGFSPERIRVQPKPGEELVVERISTTDDDAGEVLPSRLARDEDDSGREVLSIDEFSARISEAADARQAAAHLRPVRGARHLVRRCR